MALRGEKQRAAIRAVLKVFGEDAASLVVVGGCTLGLYAIARPSGAPLRVTKDVDCISTQVPWVVQEEMIARLCEARRLTPVKEVQCRYGICDTEYFVDVLSPAGMNVGGVNPWFERAASRARTSEPSPWNTLKAGPTRRAGRVGLPLGARGCDDRETPGPRPSHGGAYVSRRRAFMCGGGRRRVGPEDRFEQASSPRTEASGACGGGRGDSRGTSPRAMASPMCVTGEPPS